MAFIAPIVGLLGTAVSAFGTIAGANAQSAALDYQAQVARQKGMQEQASAQRQALESRRKGDVARSQLQARAAASGAGADDKTVVDLASDLGGRSAYQAGLQMWSGQMDNWDAQTKAAALSSQSSAVKTAGNLSAFGTILGGAGSLFKTFGSSFGTPSAGVLQPEAQPKPEDDEFNLYMGRPYWMAN